MPKSKKKRKQEEQSRSLSSSEDQQQDLGRQNHSFERVREEIVADDKDAYKNRDNKKRKKKKRKKNFRDYKEQQPSLKEGDGCNNNGRIGVMEHTGKLTYAVQQRQNEHSLKNSWRETETLPKKRKKKRARQTLSSCVCSTDHLTKNDDDDGSKKDFKNENIIDDNDEDKITLEGSMVSDILILIDRKAGRVYSATEERLQNGERKQVGRLDGKGRIVLFLKTEERENDSPCLPDNTNVNASSGDENPSSIFPFEVDPDDHCESSLEAYEDIVPLFESYARWIRKQSNGQLLIYDPYFCNGRVARHLESLGFPEVYNRKEDCYKVWKDPSLYPSYDIFLTNPPYSADHIEKLMQHVTSKQNKNKPWMLLMPNFVHKKDYFQQFTTSTGQLPIYLVPRKRYVYQPPPNMRAKKVSSTHKKSSPFVSMWYLWGGSREVTDEWYSELRKQRSATFDVARSKSALRDLRRKPKKR